MAEAREYAAPNDQHWVRALQRREAWAWVRLQESCLDSVFGYVYLRCDRREDAEDLTAEVFAAAVASVDEFRGEARIETWLIAIARRKLIDAARRKARRPEVLESELHLPAEDAYSPALAGAQSETETPEAALERREELREVRRLVLQLPEAQREALWLRCVHQLSLAETARVLRRSENAVKGLLHRARAAVLARLSASGEPPRPSPESAHVEPSYSPVCPAAPRGK